MPEGGRPLLAQMVKQDVAKLAPGAPAQRVQYCLVLAHRFAGAQPHH
jgi:hypothetical protein